MADELDVPLDEVPPDDSVQRSRQQGGSGRGRFRGRGTGWGQHGHGRGPAGRRGGRPYGQGRGSGRPQNIQEHRLHESVAADEKGDVVLTLYETEIVRAKKSGELILNSGGIRGQQMRRAINEVLQLFGLELKESQYGAHEWNVTNHSHFLRRFQDNMVVPALGQSGPGRAKVMLETLSQRIDRTKRMAQARSANRYSPY